MKRLVHLIYGTERVSTVQLALHTLATSAGDAAMVAAISSEEIGAELRRKREVLGLSLREVEGKTGISAATLSRIERGATNADLETIRQLSEWLGVSIQTGKGTSSGRSDEDLKRSIALHLRATKRLSPELASSIAEAFDVVMRVELEREKAKKKP